MDLREATYQKHREAERTELSKAMVKRELTEELYHQFVFNMAQIYNAIEKRLDFLPNDVKRSQKYQDDLRSLNRGSGTVLPSTAAYVGYLYSIEIPMLWAHVYVQYLGNMFGGQMLRERMPGPCTHLDFNDVQSCIAYVRANIRDVDPGEANKAFDHVIGIYDELYRTFGKNGASAQSDD